VNRVRSVSEKSAALQLQYLVCHFPSLALAGTVALPTSRLLEQQIAVWQA